MAGYNIVAPSALLADLRRQAFLEWCHADYNVDYTQMLSAASLGRIGELKRLIEVFPPEHRETVLARVVSERSLVGAACAAGNQGALDVMLRYIPARCLNRAATDAGDTPLILAVKRADAALTRTLLDLGVELRTVDLSGCTALEYARTNSQMAVQPDPVWRGCYAECTEALEHARRRRLRRQWQRAARLAAKLSLWHMRAAERAYAPGGLGYSAARAEFGEALGHSGASRGVVAQSSTEQLAPATRNGSDGSYEYVEVNELRRGGVIANYIIR